MAALDLNCDMGELVDPAADIAIMPYITSASIACGFHAGDADTMRRTVELALRHGVAIGAHPSLRDREGFGRQELPVTPDEAHEIVLEQIRTLAGIAKEFGTKLHHVKPHGALYNMAARDAGLAGAIANATRDFNDGLILYGLSNSCLITAGKAAGLRTASEVFADRTYRSDGSLTPRSHAGAMIEEQSRSIAQVLQMAEAGTVTDIDGRTIPIVAETLCIHGDQPNAAAFAKAISEVLTSRGIVLQAI